MMNTVYTNKRNGQVAKLVEQDDKFKTVILEMEDGSTKSISTATLKRWWVKTEVEETVEEPVVENKTETIDYTNNELVVIKSIEECLNYETLESNLEDNATYLDVTEISEITGLSIKTVKGVVGSLTKKELLQVETVNLGEKSLWVTDFGLREYFRLFGDNKNETKTETVVEQTETKTENKTTSKKSKTVKKQNDSSVEKRVIDSINYDNVNIMNILNNYNVEIIDTKGMNTLRVDNKNIARISVNEKKNTIKIQLKKNDVISPDYTVNHTYSYVYKFEIDNLDLLSKLIEIACNL